MRATEALVSLWLFLHFLVIFILSSYADIISCQNFVMFLVKFLCQARSLLSDVNLIREQQGLWSVVCLLREIVAEHSPIDYDISLAKSQAESPSAGIFMIFFAVQPVSLQLDF